MPAADRLRSRFFDRSRHPYRILDREIGRLSTDETRLLDAGCGRSAELIRRFGPRVREAVGLDMFPSLVEPLPANCHYVCGNFEQPNLESGSFDLVVCRSVMEHLLQPLSAYRSAHRMLRPGGHWVFLTPNLWDYASIISMIVPNRFHARIVALTEGRPEEDTFPAFYRSNTRRAIRRLAGQTGFEPVSIDYLSQEPSYLRFNTFAFLLGTAYAKVTEHLKLLQFLRPWLLVVLRKSAHGAGSPQ